MEPKPEVRGSIGRRIALISGVASVLLGVGLYALIDAYGTRLRNAAIDARLLAASNAIFAQISATSEAISAAVPPNALEALAAEGDVSVFYALREGGRVVTGYADLPIGTVVDDTSSIAFATAYRDQTVRIRSEWRSFAVDGSTVVLSLSVARSVPRSTSVFGRMNPAAVLGAVLAAVTVLSVAWMITRVIRRSLTRLLAWSEEDADFVTRPVAAEHAPLARRLNRMIAKAKAGEDRGKRFVDEAQMHLLRPLEKLTHRSTRGVDLAPLTRKFKQLLDEFDVETHLDQRSFTTIDLHLELRGVAQSFGADAERRGVEIVTGPLPEAEIPGAVRLVRFALTNLFENALQNAPPQSVVEVDLRCENAQAVVTICDTGRGFPLRFAEKGIERFAKAGWGRDGLGAGLGLAIAARVAEVHGGRLSLDNRDGGGACVQLFLPL